MKKLGVLLAAVLVTACGSAGPTGPEPVATLDVTRVLAFGDSLTEGESDGQLRTLLAQHDTGTVGVPSSYPAKLQGRLGVAYPAQAIHVFNAGRGGERAGSAARDRLEQELAARAPQVVLLWEGVNNLNGGADPAVVAGSIEKMVQAAQARGVAVLLATLPRQIRTSKAVSGHLVEPFNAELRAVAARTGAGLVDLHAVVTEAMLLPDGLHLSEAGNVAVAAAFHAALDARYRRP